MDRTYLKLFLTQKKLCFNIKLFLGNIILFFLDKNDSTKKLIEVIVSYPLVKM